MVTCGWDDTSSAMAAGASAHGVYSGQRYKTTAQLGAPSMAPRTAQRRVEGRCCRQARRATASDAIGMPAGPLLDPKCNRGRVVVVIQLEATCNHKEAGEEVGEKHKDELGNMRKRITKASNQPA